MKHVYFCRHGESELNVQRIFAGQTDTPLTDHGREQARLAGERAKNIAIDLIVTSPLSRASETAHIIAASIGYPADLIVANELFKERSLGSLEGKSWDEWAEDASMFPDAESEEALLARAQKGWAYLQGLAADTILLVGHGSFSRALRTAIDPSQEYQEPPNAELVKLI